MLGSVTNRTAAPNSSAGAISDGTVALPDGTIAALEVKSHGRPRHTDDLELAFYNTDQGMKP